MGDLAKLKKLTELKFARSQMTLRDIVARESALRAELLKLEQHVAQSRQQDPLKAPMRAIGADVIWQSWVDRATASINTELARVLAQKEARLMQARKTFGRVLVSRQLVDKDHADKASRRKSAALQNAIEMSVANFRSEQSG